MNERTDRRRRVCVLTGGGDAPGLNAVLRAFVTASERLGLDVLGSEDSFAGLVDPERVLVPLDRNRVRGILPRGGSILGCSNRANPFAYPSRDAAGQETFIDVSERVLRRLHDERIDILVLIGGDGTMSLGARFMEKGVSVVGIPKTIDNDLMATDMTFGFDTAASIATWAVDNLHSTAEAHDRVMIVEVMGRYAGWIALRAAIAGGADVVLIPEIPYDIQRVADKIRRRSRQGSAFSMVVVGEGARPANGDFAIVQQGREGHLPRLGGAGHAVAAALEGIVDHEVRVTVLGHLQRGGIPSSFDRMLGTRLGVHAAYLCAEGRFGRMVALHGLEISHVPLQSAVGHSKVVQPDDDLVRTARSLGIELGAE